MATKIAAVKKKSGVEGAVKKAKRVAAKAENVVEIKIGAVTVEVPKPSRAEVLRNIRSGQSALKRVQERLTRPGVTLKNMPANVPLYHADPKDANLLIRTLGKTKTTGRFVDGKFRVVHPARAKKAAA